MLDPSADEIRDWGNSVIQLMTDYLCSLRDRGVYRHMFSRRIRDRLDAALPTKGTDFDGLLRVFREDIIPFSRQNAHPRMFGYVQSPGTPIAAFADLLAGCVPLCVVANAGTVNTGAVDPLAEIREIANRFQLWMHVDGSYGALAILAKSARELFAGIERADSVALDPHKWLYLPVDVGCVIYRDPEIVHAAFAHEAEYTRIIGQEADEAFAFWDYGPELSRRFRALKVWMLLKGVGVDALSEAIENNLACARHLESMVRASDDFEMAAPVELSIFCFRHMPAQLRNESPKTIDAFNERLLVALQRDGSSYLSNATLGGRFALRGCVLNYRTTLHDIEILLDDLRRVAKSLASW